MLFEDVIKQNFSSIFQERAKDIPIDSIGLPKKTINAINASEAKNSFEAISFIYNNLQEIEGIGEKTIADSVLIANIFIQNVESASEDELKKLIDPRDVFLTSVNGNLVDAFPALIELYLSKKSIKNYERNKDILNKRYGISGNKKYTLEDLGTFYSLTRERIRQIESEMISELGLLLKSDLIPKNWKLSEAIIQSFNSVLVEFKTHSSILLKSNIKHILRERFTKTLDSQYIDLFMKVCGYIKMPTSFNGFRGRILESWIKTSNYKKNELEGTFQALDIIYDSVTEIPIFDLTVHVKNELKSKSKFLNESISIALSSIEDIERNEDSVLVKFSRLRNAADKAYRVLDSQNKPIHFSKITQEVNILSKSFNDFTPIAEMNLKNQLVADERFFPIGRSGEWALKKWDNLNNLTIIQAIEKILHLSGKPLKFSEIEAGVKKIRPDAAVNSLKVYLSDTKNFTRVGKNEFALSSWRIQPVKKQTNIIVSESDFIAEVKSVLSKENPIGLPKLITLLNQNIALASSSVRQKLLGLNGLEFSVKQGKKGKTVTCSDVNSITYKNKKRALLRDLVQAEIRAVLFEQPNIPIIKGDLYCKVAKTVDCKRPTFYRYLDDMKDIYQYNENSKFYALYQHEETVEVIGIDVNKYTTNHAIIELLKRPLAMLTVENVDIALYELGLLFETSLKSYLTKQRVLGQISVNSKDLSKLICMINCVVREGIVTKGHHLNTLREERNDRAHGGVPSSEERHLLFNKAHYIADLFVKYICYFKHLDL